MSATPVLELVNVRKSFGTELVLSDVSLTVPEHSVTVLIVASGSRKSTLMRHLSALLVGDSSALSRIEVNGLTVQERGQIAGDVRAARRNIGVIFQQFNLVNRLSVLTNVLAGMLGRVPGWRGTLGFFTDAEQRLAMQALHRVGISETARQRASTLSGGQQQRAAIARALWPTRAASHASTCISQALGCPYGSPLISVRLACTGHEMVFVMVCGDSGYVTLPLVASCDPTNTTNEKFASGSTAGIGAVTVPPPVVKVSEVF